MREKIPKFENKKGSSAAHRRTATIHLSERRAAPNEKRAREWHHGAAPWRRQQARARCGRAPATAVFRSAAVLSYRDVAALREGADTSHALSGAAARAMSSLRGGVAR